MAKYPLSRARLRIPRNRFDDFTEHAREVILALLNEYVERARAKRPKREVEWLVMIIGARLGVWFN